MRLLTALAEALLIGGATATWAVTPGAIDSPYRCPRCGKRMMMEPATGAVGEEHHWHECWDCGYRFAE